MLTRRIACAVLQRPGDTADRTVAESVARLLAFGVISGAALALSLPSVLKTVGLGLAPSATDVFLVGLGFAVAADPFDGRTVRSLSLRIAYAGLLVFAAPFLVVRVLA